MPDTPSNLPLPQTHCADCGYSLNGLPTAGNCPECGTPYDDQTLILFGWPTLYARVDPRFLLLRYITLGVSIYLLILAAPRLLEVLVALTTHSPFQSWRESRFAAAGYGIPAAILLFAARLLKRHSTRDFANPASLGTPSFQLRLSQSGYMFRDGFGPPHAFQPWHSAAQIRLSHAGALAHLVMASAPPFDYSPIQFSFPATAEQVSALRAYIDNLRANAQADPP